MDALSQYNLRQYQLMADCLKRYSDGASDLPSLIATLKALTNALEKPDPVWSAEFLNQWGALEIAWAVALDRQEREVTSDPEATLANPQYKPHIQEAVENLKQLVRTAVASYQ
jgi:hypothetical protein